MPIAIMAIRMGDTTFNYSVRLAYMSCTVTVSRFGPYLFKLLLFNCDAFSQHFSNNSPPE
jgi:hypothetical protein